MAENIINKLEKFVDRISNTIDNSGRMINAIIGNDDYLTGSKLREYRNSTKAINDAFINNLDVSDAEKTKLQGFANSLHKDTAEYNMLTRKGLDEELHFAYLKNFVVDKDLSHAELKMMHHDKTGKDKRVETFDKLTETAAENKVSAALCNIIASSISGFGEKVYEKKEAQPNIKGA